MKHVYFIFIILIFAEPILADCPDNYHRMENVASYLFMAPINGVCSEFGYSLKEIPNEFKTLFDGYIFGDEIINCNGYWSDNTCVSYSRGACPDNYYETNTDSSLFMGSINNLCNEFGYSPKILQEGFKPLLNGYIFGNEITLCDGYWSNNTCVSYSQDDCPNNYVNLNFDDTTILKINSNNTCTNAYKFNTEQCKQSTSNVSSCAILCDSDNLQYTDIGTCAPLCSYSEQNETQYKTLRTSTGLIIPMYSEKQTTPSLNIQIGNDICYVNLLPGQTSGVINIKYNGQTYHTSK